jgi:Dolichyl-phosphate-mannose-protein mannosyltransferase
VVTAWIALLGIGAVALTWWLARAIAGPLAGLVAGLLLAVSPAAIEQSTFIWNPNPIPLFAALSLAAAWQGHVTGRWGWWAVAVGAAAAVVQLHVLGVVFLVGIATIMAVEWRAAEVERRAEIRRGALGGLGLGIVLFAPLIVHELQTGLLETRRVLDYVATGGVGTEGGLPSALTFTLLRVVGWPLVALVTDAPALAAIVVAVVIALAGWLLVFARGERRTAARWLAGLLAWSVAALAVTAPSLQRVVAGLPNDHYHAFADPIVAVLIAVAAVALWERLPRPATAVMGAGIAVLLAIEVARWPPATDPDGGWLAARDAGTKIAAAVNGGTVVLIGLPDFKLADGIGFPIVHAGARLVSIDQPADAVVVACDRLFEGAIGAPCGGLAEDLVVRDLVPGAADLPYDVSRFPASNRTTISIYTPR